MEEIDLNKNENSIEPMEFTPESKKAFVAIAILLVALMVIFVWLKEGKEINLKTQGSFGATKDCHTEWLLDQCLQGDECLSDLVNEHYKENFQTILEISPRAFEKLVALALKRKGYEIEITKATRDGGKDIVATLNTPLGIPMKHYIECKLYDLDNKVGREIIQKLTGAMEGDHIHYGIVITTSCFTKDAVEYANKLDGRIILIDGNSIITQLLS